MSDIEKPVWVWLPGAQAPVQCGVFRLDIGIAPHTLQQPQFTWLDAL